MKSRGGLVIRNQVSSTQPPFCAALAQDGGQNKMADTNGPRCKVNSQIRLRLICWVVLFSKTQPRPYDFKVFGENRTHESNFLVHLCLLILRKMNSRQFPSQVIECSLPILFLVYLIRNNLVNSIKTGTIPPSDLPYDWVKPNFQPRGEKNTHGKNTRVL